jgi:hypothetical protein
MNANRMHRSVFATLSLGGVLLCGAHTAATSQTTIFFPNSATINYPLNWNETAVVGASGFNSNGGYVVDTSSIPTVNVISPANIPDELLVLEGLVGIYGGNVGTLCAEGSSVLVPIVITGPFGTLHNTGTIGTLDLNDAAVLNMYSATVGTLTAGESSIANVHGGMIASASLTDSSVLNITGGTISTLNSDATSKIKISGGAVGTCNCKLGNTVTINGGSVDKLAFTWFTSPQGYWSASNVTVSGGSIETIAPGAPVQVTISGGTVGTFDAPGESILNISGGTVGPVELGTISQCSISGGTVKSITASGALDVELKGGYVGVPGASPGYVVITQCGYCFVYGKAAYEKYIGTYNGNPVYQYVPAISATVAHTNATPPNSSGHQFGPYTEYTLSGELDDGTDVTGVQVYVDQNSTINAIVQCSRQLEMRSTNYSGPVDLHNPGR